MGRLPHGISFDQVIPVLALTFGSQDELENAVLADFSGELYEAPALRLLEEAVESGYLLPEEIEEEFGAFFRDELSEASWIELRPLDLAFLQAAALGDASSLLILSLRLVRAAIAAVDQDEQGALEEDGLFLLAEAAEAGDARAQWMLGERFSRMKDGLDESIRLLGMAAAQGFERAITRLEELFERRYTFVHTASERKWLRRFAQAGVVAGQFDLANELYLQGDLKAAFAWMLQAAKAAHQPAQQRLAFYYEVGEGCSRNPQRAEYWKNFAMRTPLPSPEWDEESEERHPFPGPIEDLEADQLDLEVEAEEEEELGAELGDFHLKHQLETPILTIEETLSEPEEIPEIEPADLPEESQATLSEPEQDFVDDAALPNQPTTTTEKSKGVAPRFRSGLARVLQRLADKVSGSAPSHNDDQ